VFHQQKIQPLNYQLTAEVAGTTDEGSCFDSNDLPRFVYFLFLASVILWLYWVILSNCSVPDWWLLLWYESYIRKITGQALMKYIALLWCRDYVLPAFSGVTASYFGFVNWCNSTKASENVPMYSTMSIHREPTLHTWHTGTHTNTILSAGFISTSGKMTEERTSTLQAQDITIHI